MFTALRGDESFCAENVADALCGDVAVMKVFLKENSKESAQEWMYLSN
jgi:hypothetical protein